MRRGSEAEEELGSVGVGPGVSHGENTPACVSVSEVLVLEFSTVDGFATSTVTSGEIATLGHETWNNTMELASLEVEVFALGAHALFTSAEGAEVFSSFRSMRRVEGHDESASILAADANIIEDLDHCVSCVSQINRLLTKISPHLK